MSKTLTLTLACLSLLALGIAPAIAQDAPDAKAPIVGKFKLRAHALIVTPPSTDDPATDDPAATPANIKVHGTGGAAAAPNRLVIRLKPLTNDDQSATVTIKFDNPLNRSDRLNGKLFTGHGIAQIEIGDEVHNLPVRVEGTIRPDNKHGATLSGRFFTADSDNPVRLRGAFEGAKVSDETDGEPPVE